LCKYQRRCLLRSVERLGIPQRRRRWRVGARVAAVLSGVAAAQLWFVAVLRLAEEEAAPESRCCRNTPAVEGVATAVAVQLPTANCGQY